MRDLAALSETKITRLGVTCLDGTAELLGPLLDGSWKPSVRAFGKSGWDAYNFAATKIPTKSGNFGPEMLDLYIVCFLEVWCQQPILVIFRYNRRCRCGSLELLVAFGWWQPLSNGGRAFAFTTYSVNLTFAAICVGFERWRGSEGWVSYWQMARFCLSPTNVAPDPISSIDFNWFADATSWRNREKIISVCG